MAAEAIQAAALAEQSQDQAPKQTITFQQYKQRLKNECEIAELRARISKANFEELAANNQFNQLAAMLQAKMQESTQLEEDRLPDPQPEGKVGEPVIDDSMAVEQP